MKFPDAEYLILSSRLIPDRDGGYTIAALARARHMAAAGAHDGRGPLLLTVDPGSAADHSQHRAAFAARGLITDPARMRNLFDEAVAPGGGAADWLLAAVRPGQPDPALEYRQLVDAHGRKFAALPVIDDPDWHISSAPIAAYRSGGGLAGILPGFGALYRAWLAHLVAGLRSADGDRPVVVICESRQVGELLVGWDDPGVRLVHSIHTVHVEPPYTPDAPTNPLWQRWFDVAERFDAVLWPTHSQRADVEQRFGASDVHVVVPQAVTRAAAASGVRSSQRVVMLNRLAPGKRIDHAIRAFVDVLIAVPDAMLDIFGKGAERAVLEDLIEELGLGGRVRLCGETSESGAMLDHAAVFLSTSAYEGQGLSIAEALAHGCPVVSYDVRYGPREALADGGGILVPDGDSAGLAAALVQVLRDLDQRERLAAEALETSRRLDPDQVMETLATVVRTVLDRPSRRAEPGR